MIIIYRWEHETSGRGPWHHSYVRSDELWDVIRTAGQTAEGVGHDLPLESCLECWLCGCKSLCDLIKWFPPHTWACLRRSGMRLVHYEVETIAWSDDVQVAFDHTKALRIAA